MLPSILIIGAVFLGVVALIVGAAAFMRDQSVSQMEDRLKTLVGTLSGGQRQALALVMATMSRPSLLLLDEHTATLDPKTARIVLELSEMVVTREKMTTMMVTHNMEVALRYGNRLIMMHKGRIIVDLDHAQRRSLAVSDLVAAFERASGEHFTDDSILLSSADPNARPDA